MAGMKMRSVMAAGLGVAGVLWCMWAAAGREGTAGKAVGRWMAVPEGTVRGDDGREWLTGGFELARTETTVGEWVRYLNETGAEWGGSPQTEKKGGRWRTAAGAERAAAGWISAEDAEGFCRWASGVEGRTVRLPREEEWEAGARGGADGAFYPWGWDDPAPGRCQGGYEGCGGALAAAGSLPGNGYGLRETSGNLWEWCAAAEGRGGRWRIRGGAWPERSKEAVRCGSGRDAAGTERWGDTGFRALRERKERK